MFISAILTQKKKEEKKRRGSVDYALSRTYLLSLKKKKKKGEKEGKTEFEPAVADARTVWITVLGRERKGGKRAVELRREHSLLFTKKIKKRKRKEKKGERRGVEFQFPVPGSFPSHVP